jgi:hypothetical protein
MVVICSNIFIMSIKLQVIQLDIKQKSNVALC